MLFYFKRIFKNSFLYPNIVPMVSLEKTNRELKEILSSYKLCDFCIGLIPSINSKNLSTIQKGKYIRENLDISKINPSNCWLCNGLSDEIPNFIKLVSEELEKYEYNSFLIGCKVDEEILEREKQFLSKIDISSTESFFKSHLNREIGKVLEEQLSKKVDFKNPDIIAIIDTSFNTVSLQIKPIYIYGRYIKKSRNIPQTKWFCSLCHGRGCRRCSYSGKLYETSVEEIIATPILRYTEGEDESFHGCGREDIDVQMLGNGRPFVIEIKNPKKRNIDFNKIIEEVNNSNMVSITNLRYSNKEEVIRLKKARFNKVYKVVIECKEAVSEEKLKKAVETLQGAIIHQFTPNRVAHRRAHLVRDRKIYSCEIASIGDTKATLIVEAESGTYIKELISGDNGNTKPSLSELLGIPCSTVTLDVIEIKGE